MEVIVHFLCMLNIFGNELHALFTYWKPELEEFSLFLYMLLGILWDAENLH